MYTRAQFPIFIAAFSAVAFTLAGGLAMAATPLDPEPAAIVRLQDLNLYNPGEVAKLYSRISRAASSVCMAANPNPQPHMSYFVRCYRDAMDRAIKQINSPELTVLHRDRVSHGSAG